MNPAQFESILRKLQRDPAAVLAAARRRSPAESIVITNTWGPQQGHISTADALDLFLSYLKEEDIPASATQANTFCDAANIALGGYLGLSKLGPAFDEPRWVKRVMDVWGGVSKWGAFIFLTRVERLEKNDSRRKTAIDVLSAAWYTLCAGGPIREIMISTPMTVEMATRLWLEEDDGPPSRLDSPAGTSFLGRLLNPAKKEHLDRVLKVAGGKADEIAKLSLSRIRSALKARPVNGTHLTMYIDLINSLSRIVDHPLRYALLGANVIWVVTNALTTIAIQVNLGRDLSFLDAMVSAFGYLANCLDSTDGFTWVSQSVGAGLLTAYVDCSPQFSRLDPEDLHMVLRIVRDILPRYTVYRTVLQAMDAPMRKIDSGPQRDRVRNSVAKDVWIPFFASSCDRIKVLHSSMARKGQHITCDNVMCQKVGSKAEVRRCSACLTTFYCSKECQAIAWKEGDHKNICKMKQRERAEGKSSRITKRDLAFFHTISMSDARKNIGKLIKRADKEYPKKIKSNLVICIDYCVFPPTFDLKPIEQYDVGPHTGSANAAARNETMIGKVKDNPGKFTLLEARIAHGDSLQAILTLATGDFWKYDPKEEQRQKMIDAQHVLRNLVSRLEAGLPASEKSPILTDPIITDFPDEELMAMQELSDEYDDYE